MPHRKLGDSAVNSEAELEQKVLAVPVRWGRISCPPRLAFSY